MSEEAPVVENWRLLIVAVVLGLIVAVVYNVHVNQIRTGVRGEMITLLQAKKDLRPGEQIKAEYIEKVLVPKAVAANLGNVMDGDSYTFALGKTVNSAVQKDNFLTYAHVTQDSASRRPSINITPGMQAFPVPVDPRLAPGEILRIGDYVNIMGIFSIEARGSSYYSVIEGVRVVEVGGHVAKDINARGASDEGWSSFRSISIEVSPKVAHELANVLSHASSVRISVRSAGDEFPANPQLSPEVAKLANSAMSGPPGMLSRPEN